LGIGPNPQSPIPNPQSPIPNPQSPFYPIIWILFDLNNNKIIVKNNKKNENTKR